MNADTQEILEVCNRLARSRDLLEELLFKRASIEDRRQLNAARKQIAECLKLVDWAISRRGFLGDKAAA